MTRNPLDDLPTIEEREASRRRGARHRVIVGREVTSCAGAKDAEDLCHSLRLVAEHVGKGLQWQLEVGDEMGTTLVEITFCPWCGERLNDRAEWPEVSR